MMSTVLAVISTPADYVVLLLGIHLKIHKFSVCFLSELYSFKAKATPLIWNAIKLGHISYHA